VAANTSKTDHPGERHARLIARARLSGLPGRGPRAAAEDAEGFSHELRQFVETLA
jgi:hypothetical protein